MHRYQVYQPLSNEGSVFRCPRRWGFCRAESTEHAIEKIAKKFGVPPKRLFAQRIWGKVEILSDAMLRDIAQWMRLGGRVEFVSPTHALLAMRALGGVENRLRIPHQAMHRDGETTTAFALRMLLRPHCIFPLVNGYYTQKEILAMIV